VASENLPPPYEILITPLILCEILIAPKASFYNLKYVKIVSGERGENPDPRYTN
jgi:hypothetical protein